MRTLPLLAALAALSGTAHAQGFGTQVDETAGGGMEEAAALYFAPPPTEEAEAAIDTARLPEAGTVQLAIALGQIEEGLAACQDLRRQMQSLIGDTYGSYSVNPGWLRRYQACVVARAEEVRAAGAAIRARQTDLISRIGSEEAEDVDAAEDAMRAADLMARLAARQSDVKIEVSREGRRQRAFVGYYNTGEFPDALRETPKRAQVRVPAGERGLPRDRPVLRDVPGAAPDLAPSPTDASIDADSPLGGAILMPGDELPNAVPDDAFPTPDFTPPEGATGAPTPLHNPDAEPVPAEGSAL